MAYTTGIFHIDYVNGSDTARTALTSVSFAWNAGTSKMRATKTAHGLTTGAIVDVTGTTGLNDAWKITQIDANTFDLDASSNVSNTSGTVTPRGGSSWSDAWKTFNAGATAARIQPGDEIKVAKTPDPVSTGINSTWTNGSNTVSLASPLTKTVENCTATTGWVASADISLANNSNRKIGANSLAVTPAVGFTTGKVCYKDLGSNIDFSGYTKLSFFFRPLTNTMITASTYRICLCSDTTGDTIVNQLSIPATLATSAWHIMVLDNGSALGSSIRSVAIYADSDPGTTIFCINNVVACNNVTHETLVGPASDDCLYNIQSFTDTTIAIDSNNTSAAGLGWYGNTVTATLLYRTGINFLSTGANLSVPEPGNQTTANNLLSFGWNTSNNSRDGLTLFSSTIIGSGTIMNNSSNWNYWTIENLIIARFNGTIVPNKNLIVNNCVICGGGGVFTGTAGVGVISTFNNVKFLNNSGSVVPQTQNISIFNNCLIANTTNNSIIWSGVGYFNNCVLANNQSGFNLDTGVDAFLRDCLVLDTPESGIASLPNNWVWSYNHDQVEGNHWGFSGGATCNWQTTEKQGTDPGSWDISIVNSGRTTKNPVRITAAEIAVTANNLVTVKVWVKKAHATNVGCRIGVLGSLYTLPGISETYVTAANNTNWQELTLTFTPTAAGVVPIYFDGYYVAANGDVFLGSVTITQA